MNIIIFIRNLIVVITMTIIFDFIRDQRCKYFHKADFLSSRPNLILDKNWKVVILSYNYGLFYGIVFGYLYNKLFSQSIGLNYFLAISLLQRIMCAYVMPSIHRRTSPFVHSFYYLFYYIGSMLSFMILKLEYDNINLMISYMLYITTSLAFSLIYIYANNRERCYSWQIQYMDERPTTIEYKDRNSLFNEQVYSIYEYYHLRLVALLSLPLYAFIIASLIIG